MQTGPPRNMQSATFRSSTAAPWRDSAHTMSRSEIVPSTVSPSSETISAPIPADVNRWMACAREAPPVIVSTVHPFDWRMLSTFIAGLPLRQRARPWYSRLGIMPVAMARRLVKLYMAATSMMSQMASSVKPSARSASMSASSQASGSVVIFTA